MYFTFNTCIIHIYMNPSGHTQPALQTPLVSQKCYVYSEFRQTLN